MERRADQIRVGDLLVSLHHPGTRVVAVERVDGWVRLTVERPSGETFTRPPLPPDWPVDTWPTEDDE